ncbi:MAG: hypothetical protein AB9866_17235 [Syntrophobacteraceae bacterium]
MKRTIVMLSVFAMLAATAIPAFAEKERLPPDPSLSGNFMEQYMGEQIIFDVFVLRPIGFVASMVGLGASVGAYPFACATDSADRVDRELVQKPWAWTFNRPVGDIEP